MGITDHSTANNTVVFPVPANENVFVQLSDLNTAQGDISVMVTDASGRVMSTEQETLTSNSDSQTIRISTGNLAEGFYFISILQNGEITSSARFVVMR